MVTRFPHGRTDNRQEIVVQRGTGLAIGCVLFAGRGDEILVVKKASRHDYEFSGLWALPGGVVRCRESPGEMHWMPRGKLPGHLAPANCLLISSMLQPRLTAAERATWQPHIAAADAVCTRWASDIGWRDEPAPWIF